MVLRLQRVKGYEKRINDILYKPAKHSHNPQTLVFFGGDVQDYPERMQIHKANKKHIKWNLENATCILSDQFSESHIVVVKPSRMEFGTLSCYDNFVLSDAFGVPNHMPNNHALTHLERLLQNVANNLRSLPVSSQKPSTKTDSLCDKNKELIKSTVTCSNYVKDHKNSNLSTPELNEWCKDINLLDYPITLVGFSKGCVVLNQMLHEFHFAQTTAEMGSLRFMKKIQNMYWLDGGHSGRENAWITSHTLLETLSRLGINVYVHVSPYQVNDDSRPWIGREEKIFTQLLTQLKANVRRYLHGKVDSPHTLEMHFQVLADFVHVQNNCQPTNVPDISYDKR